MDTNGNSKLLKTISDTFARQSATEIVFGEPIQAEGKTIITVARLVQGFGGAYEQATADTTAGDTSNKNGQEGGGGLGGGMVAKPVGLIEITSNRTRFIRFNNSWPLAIAAALGYAAARILKYGISTGFKKKKKAKKKKKK